MNQFLETLRKLRVRRSTIWLGVAWVAIFVLYLGVRPEPVPQQTAVPVVPVPRTPEPTQTIEPTSQSTTTTTTTTIPPTSTTPSGALNRTSPSATTTTQVIPLIPNELIPPGLLPQPTATPTESPR
jgi:hypothetical protein